MNPRESFLGALRALAAAFAAAPPGAAALIGGVAANARGVERYTSDIDALIGGGELLVDRALELLGRHEIVPRIADAEAFARKSHVLLMVHSPTGTAIDVSFGFLPFEREALAAAEPLDFEGVSIAVLRAEDLVIQKTVAWRPIDRQDIERLLLLWGAQIDFERVRAWVAQFAELLDDPGRVEEFEQIARRALDR